MAIEAIFVVLETIKNNFTKEEARLSQTMPRRFCGDDSWAWWATLGFWGICTVVGAITVGIAGIACAGLEATGTSYCNYQNQ